MSTETPLVVALLCATPGTAWGGMETHTLELANALSARGHKVHVFAHPSYASNFAQPLFFHATPFQLGRRNLWLRFRLKRSLSALHPNIVHAQGNKAAAITQSVSPNDATTIGTVHGTKTSHKPFSKLDGVIGVSSDIVDAVDHKTVKLIHNGSSLPKETPQTRQTDCPIPDQHPLLVAAGRLEPVKQFDQLIHAFHTTGAPGHLTILGEGSQRPELEHLVQSLGLEHDVSLPGYETNLTPWLNQASACVISSEREGFPYTVVEALHAHCPVLSTPVSGVSEFLPDEAIASACNADAIAELLSAHLSNPGHFDDLQQTSFNRARTELSADAMAAKTEAFYHELLADSARGKGK